MLQQMIQRRRSLKKTAHVEKHKFPITGDDNWNQPGGLNQNTVDGSEILRENQLRLVVYPVIYRVLYIRTVVVWDF